MKKTLIITTLTLCLSIAASAQKADTTKTKPSTDTLVVPASAQYIKVQGRVINTQAFNAIPVFLTQEVLEFIVLALINGSQPQYSAQQMSQHVTIIQQLQKLLPPKK